MSGALVISLDFERHWGVLDQPLDGPYRANLLGVPASVRGTLQLFREFEVAATWATVGFLFARSREEREQFAPAVRPRYRDGKLDPYAQPTGEDELTDPFHYGSSLISEIAQTPRQELATHTHSHFFCLEPAEDAKAAFRADLQSACAIMQATCGVQPRSIVFPGNQHNPDFDEILIELGICCYRGNPTSWMWRPRHRGQPRTVRVARLLDAFIPLGGQHLSSWATIPQANGTFNVRASYFLRPGSRGLRARRIVEALHHAADRDEVLHLWWHPHNFGVNTAENLAVLRTILQEFAHLRQQRQMLSLTMAEAADEAARRMRALDPAANG